VAPTGTTLPIGDRPGWHQVVAESFSGNAVPSGWGTYEGHPGGEPDGMWLPSHVTVNNGAMHLNGYKDGGRWVTGGVMNSHAASMQYGKYEVRFRMTKGVGVKYAILLWPHTADWPVGGEIDFAEDGGSGTRNHTSATMHYGTDNSTIQREITGVDFSQWHTVGVEWTAGKIVYTLDGKQWGTVVSSNVPRSVMDLAIQTETGTCGERWLGCPDATTPSHVNLDVDWVSVWKKV
jgi:beta-glucanase (GH16 family)